MQVLGDFTFDDAEQFGFTYLRKWLQYFSKSYRMALFFHGLPIKVAIRSNNSIEARTFFSL